jgi:hypothetical protein
VKDPYLSQILGLLAAGMTSTALAVSGYLHQLETVRLLGTQLTYQAAYRKIPLSLMGTGLCVSAWLLTQTRRDYRRQYEEWERQTRLQQGQMQAIAHHAELEGYQQVAHLHAAERLYPQMAPYLSDVQDADYQDVTAPAQPSVTPQPKAETTAPGPVAMPVTPTSEPTADPTAYLQNFLEYPGCCLVAWVRGKVGPLAIW